MRRLLIVIAPWLVVIGVCSPLLIIAPRMLPLMPGALFLPFAPPPPVLPYCAAAGWAMYVALGWRAVTRAETRSFWRWWSCGFALLVCNLAAVAHALFALKGLR